MSSKRPLMPEVEELSRLQVVERAGRALKLLLPLAQLCDELGDIDNIDRAAADAQRRHDALVSDLLAQRQTIEADNAAAKAKAGEMVGKAMQEAELITTAAKRRASDLEAKALKRDAVAGEAFDKAEAGRAAKLAELASEIQSATAARDGMVEKLAVLREDVAAAEKKIADVRKKAQAALGELGMGA